MRVNFSKYEGAGNDFLLIDGRERDLAPEEAVMLCHRRRGVGADGVILLRQSLVANYGMAIINADGSSAEMCGNGLRCLARYIEELGDDSPTQTIETPAGILTTTLIEEEVEASMPQPKIHDWTMEVEGLKGTFLNTGVPHFVTRVEDINSAPLHLGKKLCTHSAFGTAGTNVDFVQVTESNSLMIRTFERGIGEETLACGTGAVAAALTLPTSSPVAVTTRSGDMLTIRPGPLMRGPARRIFTGHATLPAPTMAVKCTCSRR